MLYQDDLDADALRRYAAALNHRAQAQGAAGHLAPQALQDRIFQCAGVCEWCGRSIVGQPFEIDHIVSLMRGGDNTPQNLAIACPDCNRRKSHLHAARFAQQIAAQTGLVTPLVARVLAHFGVSPQVQRSLFDAPPMENDVTLDADDPDDIAPYRW